MTASIHSLRTVVPDDRETVARMANLLVCVITQPALQLQRAKMFAEIGVPADDAQRLDIEAVHLACKHLRERSL